MPAARPGMRSSEPTTLFSHYVREIGLFCKLIKCDWYYMFFKLRLTLHIET